MALKLFNPIIEEILNLYLRTLLNKVAEILPAQLKTVASEETYNVGKHPESAALTVSGGTVTVSVTLTSPLMRDATKPAAPAGNFIVFRVQTGQEKDNQNVSAISHDRIIKRRDILSFYFYKLYTYSLIEFIQFVLFLA